MNYMVFMYKWWSRELRKVVNALLKSWLVKEIEKMNYVQSFSLNEKNVKKSEIKLLFLLTDNQEKLLDFVSKNFPEVKKMNMN